jgi:hypothetical protein
MKKDLTRALKTYPIHVISFNAEIFYNLSFLSPFEFIKQNNVLQIVRSLN